MPAHPVILDEEYFTLFLTGGYFNIYPSSSLGGVFSNRKSCLNEIPSTLFNDVAYSERVSGSTKYRALCFKNIISSDAEDYTFYNVKLWVDGTCSSGETILISTASSGLQTGMVEQWTMSSLSDENAAPVENASLTWYSASQTMSIGDIPTGSGMGIWVKRVVPIGAPAMRSTGVTIKVYVDAIGGALVI